MKTKQKQKRVDFRLTEIMFRRLMAIVRVTGKSRTAVIEDLIAAEYDKSRKYRDRYYGDLEKKPEEL